MLHYPLPQQKSTPPAQEFAADLTLLSQHQPQLDRIELAVLKSYDWKPSVPDPVISKTPLPSVQDALREWARDMDDWHMTDDKSYISFDQVVDAPWCTRYKNTGWLKRFLKEVDFPARFLEQELISKGAYEKALEICATRRREKNKAQMQKSRSRVTN